MAILTRIILFVLIGFIYAAPTQNEKDFVMRRNDPELTAGYFEGDMILDTERVGLKNPTYKWPNNTVYYKFYTQLDDEHRNHILKGMRNIEAVSCIIFKEATEEQAHYVRITADPGGCFSSVGYRQAVQSYNLEYYPIDEGCFRLATVMHEFLHTLGFYHTQSASDRDEYVKIVEKNITPGLEHNFAKYDDNTVEHYDDEYDYGSVMHYPPYAFSENGEMTIVPIKDPEAIHIMGQRRGMSKSDINKLNTMYRCPSKA